MTAPFRKFVASQAIIVAAFNAAINASYTGWLWSVREVLPLSGADSIGLDLAATPVVIAVLSALLGTPFIRQKLRDGRVAMPVPPPPGVLHAMPRGLVQRALALGLATAVLLALPLWLALLSSGIETCRSPARS